MSDEKIRMKIVLEVTIPEALTLQAMFKHWNNIAEEKKFKTVALNFDGKFNPKCDVQFSMPPLSEEIEISALSCDEEGLEIFDFNNLNQGSNNENPTV